MNSNQYWFGLDNFSLDRWDFYKEYIETVIRLVEVKTSNDLSAVDNDDDKSTGDQIDDSFELCHEFLCEVSIEQFIIIIIIR